MRWRRVCPVDVLSFSAEPVWALEGWQLFALACGGFCLMQGEGSRFLFFGDRAEVDGVPGVPDFFEGSEGCREPREYSFRHVLEVSFFGRSFALRYSPPGGPYLTAFELFKLSGGGFLGVAEWQGGGRRLRHVRTFVRGGDFFPWAKVVPFEIVQAVRRLHHVEEREGR